MNAQEAIRIAKEIGKNAEKRREEFFVNESKKFADTNTVDINWFLILIGLLYAGAMIFAIYHHNWKIAGLMFLYGISSFVLATMKG